MFRDEVCLYTTRNDLVDLNCATTTLALGLDVE